MNSVYITLIITVIIFFPISINLNLIYTNLINKIFFDVNAYGLLGIKGGYIEAKKELVSCETYQFYFNFNSNASP